MLWKRKPTDKKSATCPDNDKRAADRVEIMSPYICTLKLAQFGTHLCIARNIGTGGILVELQTEPEISGESDGLPCAITDMMPEHYHTLHDVHGTVEWIYRKFVGIAFRESIFGNHEAILSWLKKLHISYRELPPQDS